MNKLEIIEETLSELYEYRKILMQLSENENEKDKPKVKKISLTGEK